MLAATPIPNAIQVIVSYPFEGHEWLEVHCLNYDEFAALPAALQFNGRLYGRTGWNSDRFRAYYSTRQLFAIGV